MRTFKSSIPNAQFDRKQCEICTYATLQCMRYLVFVTSFFMYALDPFFVRLAWCLTLFYFCFFFTELIKSVHLYMDDGFVTAVQQEFLLSPDVYTQISEPIPSYFSRFAHNGAKQFIDTLKQLNEADLWQCVLEYHVHTPQDTSIIPLLSVSKYV